MSLICDRLPWWLRGKEPTCQCRRCGFNPWVREISWRRKWQPTLVSLPGRSHGQRSLAACSPWGCKELNRFSNWAHTYVKSKKNYTSDLSHKTEIDSRRQETNLLLPNWKGREINQELGLTCTVYKIDSQQVIDTYIYIYIYIYTYIYTHIKAGSLSCTPETNTTL